MRWLLAVSRAVAWLAQSLPPGGAWAIAAEYHVSPTGNHASKGTAASPWSLQAANAAVKPEDVVILHEGTYKTPIQPRTSGAAGTAIRYTAARDQL